MAGRAIDQAGGGGEPICSQGEPSLFIVDHRHTVGVWSESVMRHEGACFCSPSPIRVVVYDNDLVEGWS
jgi:hypothetical protein